MSWYGFFVAMGAVTAIAWLRSRHRRLGLTENQLWAALWCMTAGAVIGAKALFVVLGWHHFESGELRFFPDFGTGFVFFGGLAGAGFVGVLFARWQRLEFWRGADYFGVALPLAHAIGRVGCFAQGCCPGRPPHPVQLYESAGLAGLCVVAHLLVRRIEAGRLPTGMAFCAYLGGYGILRAFLDPLRADGRPERWWGISHQQLIALALVSGAGLAAWIRRSGGKASYRVLSDQS
jgi:phosphatidylglycerol---prolipoprotein diacylglyceryl transferase